LGQLASLNQGFHDAPMCVDTQDLLYLLPFLPVLGRSAIIAGFAALQNDILSEEEHDREGYRTHILAMAGLSFMGVSAFAVVETTLKTGLSRAINYFLLSFFAYMFSLNVVYVKGRRWQDQLATAFSEMGTLSLFLALIATLRATQSNAAVVMAAIATLVWVMDHSYRICLDWNHQSKLLKLRK
jgi:hypothetical protein